MLLEAYKSNLDTNIIDVITQIPCHSKAAKKRLAQYLFDKGVYAPDIQYLASGSAPPDSHAGKLIDAVNVVNIMRNHTEWDEWSTGEIAILLNRLEYE